MRKYSAEEKNNMVKKVLSGTKSINEIVEADHNGPAESTIKSWIRRYKTEGPFLVQSNNDAVASWSGYSYQGKMAILCTLEKLNTLFDSNGWEKWKLQLEKSQDFVLINDEQVESLWQVKALLSTKNYQSYVKAMEKLLKDRDNCGFLSAKCYLVTANEVHNWSDSKNNFKNEITLYEYKGESVSVTLVSEKIQEQVAILIDKMGIDVDKEAAYLLLCALIDDRVAQFHKEGKKSEYVITFEEIVQRIKDTESFEVRICTLRIKENIYNNLSEKIVNGSHNYCTELCEKKGSIDCKDEKCVINRNRELVERADIEYYMKSIRPEIEKDIDLIFSNPDDYADTICTSVCTAPESALELDHNIISVSCYKGEIKVIPTMLDMSMNRKERLSRKLNSIERNEWLKENIGTKILLGKTENKIYGTRLSKFTDIKLTDLLNNLAVVDKKDVDVEACMKDNTVSEKATEISNSIIVIDSKWLVNYFGEEKDEK